MAFSICGREQLQLIGAKQWFVRREMTPSAW